MINKHSIFPYIQEIFVQVICFPFIGMKHLLYGTIYRLLYLENNTLVRSLEYGNLQLTDKVLI